MYVIIVYDVRIKRIDKIRKFLRRYLNWIQNSVFEGEITKAELKEVKRELNEKIQDEEDSVIIFKSQSKKWIKKTVLGVEKEKTSRII